MPGVDFVKHLRAKVDWQVSESAADALTDWKSAKLKELHSVLKDRDRRVGQLERELARALEAWKSANGRLAHFKGQLKARQGAEQRAAVAEAAANEATRQLHGAQADALTLRHELGSRIKDHDCKVVELQGALSTSENARRAAEGMSGSLQQRAAAAEAAMSELDQRDELRAALDKATVQLAGEQQALRSLAAQGSLRDALVQSTAARASADATRLVEQLSSQLDTRHAEAADLAARLASADALIQRLKHRIQADKMQLENHEREAAAGQAQADRQAAAARNELGSLQRSQQALREQHRMTENLATLVIVCHIFSPHGFDMLVQLSLLAVKQPANSATGPEPQQEHGDGSGASTAGDMAELLFRGEAASQQAQESSLLKQQLQAALQAQAWLQEQLELAGKEGRARAEAEAEAQEAQGLLQSQAQTMAVLTAELNASQAAHFQGRDAHGAPQEPHGDALQEQQHEQVNDILKALQQSQGECLELQAEVDSLRAQLAARATSGHTKISGGDAAGSGEAGGLDGSPALLGPAHWAAAGDGASLADLAPGILSLLREAGSKDTADIRLPNTFASPGATLDTLVQCDSPGGSGRPQAGLIEEGGPPSRRPVVLHLPRHPLASTATGFGSGDAMPSASQHDGASFGVQTSANEVSAATEGQPDGDMEEPDIPEAPRDALQASPAQSTIRQPKKDSVPNAARQQW
ncbi:hypothetical protein WJX84_000941 [Apatococcus fuscideae]|uniref:Uncharacterized protein n=1 Tax=Apatococcus fuscideae TaxID=2026836 RepID=A0AAW1SPF8_9CHLO